MGAQHCWPDLVGFLHNVYHWRYWKKYYRVPSRWPAKRGIAILGGHTMKITNRNTGWLSAELYILKKSEKIMVQTGDILIPD